MKMNVPSHSPAPRWRERPARLATAMLLGLLMTGPAVAGTPEKGVSHDMVIDSAGFLAAHPDLRWRREGLYAFEQGRLGEAATAFRRAARYADKASQAMYAEMLWNGTGVPRDRVMAYAWMDLAAERLYKQFIAKREYYWGELTEAERQRALADGPAIYDEYGDAVAKPRLELLLKRAKRDVTGSRVGHVGNLEVMVPGPGGEWQRISGNEFYKPEYWEPEKYWAWQDDTWHNPNTGRVDVLPIEKVEDAPADDGDR